MTGLTLRKKVKEGVIREGYRFFITVSKYGAAFAEIIGTYQEISELIFPLD